MQCGLRRSALGGLNATPFPAKAAQGRGTYLTPFLKQCAGRPTRQAMLYNTATIDPLMAGRITNIGRQNRERDLAIGSGAIV